MKVSQYVTGIVRLQLLLQRIVQRLLQRFYWPKWRRLKFNHRRRFGEHKQTVRYAANELDESTDDSDEDEHEHEVAIASQYLKRC